MKKKKPTIADLMKKLEELEAEVKALRAAPIHYYYYYHYYPPYYGTPVQPWAPYTITVPAPSVTSGSTYYETGSIQTTPSFTSFT